MIKVKAKSGKLYYYLSYYKKKERQPPTGELRLSKSGRAYRNYYKRKLLDGVAPYSKFNRDWCLERDDFTCQKCGTKESLDVHHIDKKGTHIALRDTNNSLSNLLTLCHRCHLRLHYPTNERNQDIVKRRLDGETLQKIANSYNTSRQRIHQIIKSGGTY